MAINDIAFIEKTVAGQVDEVLAAESFTDALIGGGAIKLEYVDAKTVKIFKLATTGLVPYVRGGHGGTLAEQGAVNSALETFTLSQERFSAIPLDKLDTLDDAGTVLGRLAKEFIRVHVVHEMDTYRFSKLVSFTNEIVGNKVVETIADNTIISKFNAALKWLSEQKVPNSEQIIYVNPSIMQKIRNTSELAKRLNAVRDMNSNIKFSIEEYEGRKIVEVPSDTFYTDATVGKGIYPSANSKIINFLIVWKKAPIIAKKLAWAKVYSSDQVDLGYVGYKFDNLYYHDIFCPDNKALGIYASISNESALNVGAGLLPFAVAGVSTGKTKIEKVITQPAGQFYDALYLCNDAAAPAIGAVSTGYTQIYENVEFVPDNTHNFIIASKDGKVVCVSKDYGNTLPKGQ